jgi:Domain of unknown function (DUF4153)
MSHLLVWARSLAARRLLVAALQGAALWFLQQAAMEKQWPATDEELFNLLLAVALFVPFIAVAGLGNLRPKSLIAWLVVATLLCAGLGFHAVHREGHSARLSFHLFDDWLPFLFSLAILIFIAHSLVRAADSDRRWIARFPTYFDVAWHHATQLGLAILFVGAFWIVLALGAWLFRLIGITIFTTIIEESWFWIPATTLAASMALHLTDSRTAMVRGARTLVLGMLSWLMPILVLIGLAFLVALPFTGLEPLWNTRYATFSLLAASVLLILLINSHFQDGDPENNRPGVLLYARLIAAVMLTPLVVLAAIGLALRVEQYGWTPSRVVAAAVVIAVACHAAGYLVAVVRSGIALSDLPITNVLSAMTIVALMIALMTPLADPARLSVADQVGRLLAGRVPLEKFDFAFLQRHSGRYGQAALARLKAGAPGLDPAKVEKRANAAVGVYAPLPPPTEATRRANIRMVRPADATLPADFLQVNWQDFKQNWRLPSCLTWPNRSCEGFLVDLTGDSEPEIVLFDGSHAVVFTRDAAGKWTLAGEIANLHCKGAIEALRSGNFETVPSAFKDIQANGARWPVTPFCGPW